jgi:hypothetical protein
MLCRMSLPSLGELLPNAVPAYLWLVIVVAVVVSSSQGVSSYAPVFALIRPLRPGCSGRRRLANAWPPLSALADTLLPLIAYSGGCFAATVVLVVSLRVDVLPPCFCYLGGCFATTFGNLVVVVGSDVWSYLDLVSLSVFCPCYSCCSCVGSPTISLVVLCNHLNTTSLVVLYNHLNSLRFVLFVLLSS